MEETLGKCTKPAYTENDLKGDRRFEGKMMWRKMELLIRDRKRRIG
jgi:hypothetical protein